jgi:hypothetical protein
MAHAAAGTAQETGQAACCHTRAVAEAQALQVW